MTINRIYDYLNTVRNMPVEGLMEPSIIISKDEPLSKIISTLIETDSYDVFIELSGKVAALNIRDIIGAKDIKTTRPSLVGKIIPELNRKSVVGEAARIMSHYRMRTLPVVQNGQVEGQVSARRIVDLINKQLVGNKLKINASNIMTGDPLVIDSHKTVSAAMSIMKRRRIDHLPVVDNGLLVGIITSSDIMKVMSPTERIGKKSIGINNAEDRLSIEVSGLANDDVITASVDESLQGVCDRMISAGSSYCIIKVWDEIQGIITYRDIVALLGEKIEEDIPMFIVGLPDEPLDAELAKSKFANITKFMRRIHPDIEQARCHIKLRRVLGSRKRYEIDVHVRSTHGNISYTNVGWDLAKLFDEMNHALKKRVAHKNKRNL
ncbi:MAG: CBS domain-containing protein [Nitrososphaeraceae archaeon]|nr:CBS domain-containing protein [Nitrososphaeraceae archaeon]MDW0147425.1 CBS domain-containing protein [Nitrososphaeraceae archaeon]MDW0157860.1 CBS domain-containing protein [Nitrososphaeraceae archaeon]